MHILVITFEPVAGDDASYRQQAAAFAPYFNNVPGLVSKTWLADPERNIYGGICVFSDGASLAAFLASKVAQGLRANPIFANVAVHVFNTIAAAVAVIGDPQAAKVTAIGGSSIVRYEMPGARPQLAISA